MSNLLINIRVFTWHLQWIKGQWHPILSRNCYHKTRNWPDGYFSVYKFFGYTKP